MKKIFSFKISLIYKEFEKIYDKDFQFLNCKNDWHLFVAVLLTPQTTDKKTNEVLPILFSKYDTYKKLAKANLDDVKEILKVLGFYKKKSVYIIEAAKYLVKNSGKIPDNIQGLLKIKGMGRKCSGVILNYIYNQPAIIADTHFIRVNNRLGFSKSKDPFILEKDIKSILKEELWSPYSILANIHAREICKAKAFNCSNCFINSYCAFFKASHKGGK